MELVIRPSLGLRLFLAPRRRHAQFEVPYDGAASLGHVVQSLAIPLTEVDGATIHDVRSGPSVPPRPGAVIEFEPPPHPQTLPHEVGFLLGVGLSSVRRHFRSATEPAALAGTLNSAVSRFRV